MQQMPEWNIPGNLQELIDADSPDGDGMWADDSWDPILLTVGAGTSLAGRAIPLYWQMEFEPGDEGLKIANKRLQDLGLEPDVYGWAKLIEDVYAKDHPEPVDELHFADTELATCVVWAESPSTCRTLNRSRLVLIHDS